MHGMRKSRGQLLRVLRAAHEPRLTQSKVATLLGISRMRYWQIEAGEGPDATAAEKAAVAKVLGVKVADIEWPSFARAKAS